ncbi:MAG: hypothetical protein ACR2PL_22825 [Dehalococcoidia bacterium]
MALKEIPQQQTEQGTSPGRPEASGSIRARARAMTAPQRSPRPLSGARRKQSLRRAASALLAQLSHATRIASDRFAAEARRLAPEPQQPPVAKAQQQSAQPEEPDWDDVVYRVPPPEQTIRVRAHLHFRGPAEPRSYRFDDE